jgi:hypothetical protein
MKRVFYILSFVALFAWVIPNYFNYSKNRDIYYKKLDSLERLDKREIPSDAKKFHAELFKEDIKRYFNGINDINVTVLSIPNNKYEIKIIFPKSYLSNFLKALYDIPLNYRVYLDDTIVYRQSNKIIEVSFIVTPY